MDHITLPVFDERGAVRTREMLEVSPVSPGHWRLLHSPAFVDGIAGGDVIELDADVPEGFRVVSRGGNLAIIVAVANQDHIGEPGALRLRESLVAVGGTFDGGSARMLVFTVPVTVGFAAIERVLSEFLESVPGATWWYGNVYERGDGARPLRWWTDTSENAV